MLTLHLAAVHMLLIIFFMLHRCSLFSKLKNGVIVPNSRREQDKTFAAIYRNLKYDPKEVSMFFLYIRIYSRSLSIQCEINLDKSMFKLSAFL